MKQRALQLAKDADPSARKNVLREYIQAHVLRSLTQGGGFEQLAFLGGTALRFLHGLRRFSEDLDFSLARAEGYSFDSLLERITSDFKKAGFEITVHPAKDRTVQSAFLRFPGLLYELDLSPHPDEKLSVKIEIDTNPPSGANLETTVLNKYFLLSLWHYDLPSMLAGKLHALLSRDYTKGRDIYDLLWYRSRPDPVEPNLPLLNNALKQTGWEGGQLEENSWTKKVKEKLKNLNWDEVAEDVEPFLESPEERKLLTVDKVLSVL